jgi:hypothetical protein
VKLPGGLRLRVKSYPADRDQVSAQTGAAPIFSNKKSMKILTFAVSTFDFG